MSNSSNTADNNDDIEYEASLYPRCKIAYRLDEEYRVGFVNYMSFGSVITLIDKDNDVKVNASLLCKQHKKNLNPWLKDKFIVGLFDAYKDRYKKEAVYICSKKSNIKIDNIITEGAYIPDKLLHYLCSWISPDYGVIFGIMLNHMYLQGSFDSDIPEEHRHNAPDDTQIL
jgi:hypothetical protein